MEPLRSRIWPLLILITALLAARGWISEDDRRRYLDYGGAVLALIGGGALTEWARAKVTPVRPLPDGSWGVVSDAAVRGNVPLNDGPAS